MPVYLDWRGRIYTRNLLFSYQSNEFNSALVMLADAQPLTSSGLFWFKVYGANCYGFDKVSFDERVQWVDKHRTDIMTLSSDFVMKADSPIKFVAFALTMQQLYKDPKYPVAQQVFLDATCSGLQHISGVLHDATLGTFVNLRGNTRNDLYQHMVDVVNKVLQSSENSKFRLLKLSRAILKNPIMCIPYAITVHGISDYLRTEFVYDASSKSYKIDKFTIDGSTVFLTPSELYSLSSLIYETFLSTFPSIKDFYNYLAAWVKIARALDIQLSWTTPTGTFISPGY